MTSSHRISAVVASAVRERLRATAMAIKPETIHRVHERLQFGARLVLGPIVVLLLVMLALQFGVWRKEYKFAGPFSVETGLPGAPLVLDFPSDPPTQWWRRPE